MINRASPCPPNSVKPYIAMEKEIKAAFRYVRFVLKEKEQILKTCLTLCKTYSLTPIDLVRSYDNYSIMMNLGLTVKKAHMDEFSLHLQNEKEPDMHLYSRTDATMIPDDEPEDPVGKSNGGTHASGQNSVSVTPFGQRESEFVVQSTLNTLPKMDTPFDSVGKSNGGTHASGQNSVSVTPFGQRKSKFVVKSTLNTLPKTGTFIEQDQHMSELRTSSTCSLVVHSKYMYDKIKNKRDVLDVLENRILKFGETLVASGLCEELVDPTIASQGSVCAVGMICCEDDGEKTIALKCSVKHSGRVRLDLQQLSDFSIFPGQIVGIQGHNPTGHCFIVSEIIKSMPPSTSSDENLRPSKKQAVEPTDPSHARADLSLIIAAGPFTTTDNLLFEPLTELLAHARKKQPQLLILLGPFVDSEHPEIKKGFLGRTNDQVFHDEIIERLRVYVEGSAARVILVPSVRDASHDLVFPQPPFKIDRELENQITCVTNPGVFSANKVKIACCTTDVLLQLSSVEISGSQRSYTPRINRVASYLISQRSFYPLYPPAENVPLDSSLAPEVLQMSSIPDILILPSVLTCFLKVLSVGEEKEGEKQVKCICVNPGRLARGEGAGFFAEINYHESPELSTGSVLSI